MKSDRTPNGTGRVPATDAGRGRSVPSPAVEVSGDPDVPGSPAPGPDAALPQPEISGENEGLGAAEWCIAPERRAMHLAHAREMWRHSRQRRVGKGSPATHPASARDARPGKPVPPEAAVAATDPVTVALSDSPTPRRLKALQ